MNLILIFVGAVLVNNFVMNKFMGCCPFLGVSKKTETAFGMGMAVTFVITIASLVTYFVRQLLVALELEYLQTIAFILVIAVLVQVVELVLRKLSYALYQALGVYLPLITTNCAVLGVALLNTREGYNLIESVVNGTSAATFSPNSSITRQQVWMILARLSGADPANMSAAREWAVTNGVSDGTTPGGAVTRQQLVALLYRYATLMGYANDQRADLSAYPDAGTVAGYAVEPMQWSVANSIVGGTSNGTLDPTGTATRAQFAVILYRFWDQVG